MIIYEVNLDISKTVIDAYLPWLKSHIHEMLQFSGFKRCTVLNEVIVGETERVKITAQYHIETMEQLDDYLQHHAIVMREDGLKRFPGQFTATRRIFELMDL